MKLINCPYCGTKVKKVIDKYFCPNCGVVAYETDKEDEKERSYIG